MIAQTIYTHIQKEIQNDEDSQTNSVWTKYSNQEKNRDFRKNMAFLEMKDAFRDTTSRTQVRLYRLKNAHFYFIQNCLIGNVCLWWHEFRNQRASVQTQLYFIVNDLKIVGYGPVSLFWDSYWNNVYRNIETHSSKYILYPQHMVIKILLYL